MINPDAVTYNYATTATNASPVGTYPINATVLGAVLSNYNLVVNAGTLTIVPQATNIVAQTTGQTVCSGVTIPLSVTATGNNLTYQWYKDNAIISGQTSTLLTLTNVTATTTGLYFVSVTGLGGTVASNNINIQVNTQSLGALVTTQNEYRANYNDIITATLSPSTFAISNGTLPNGITLNNSTGALTGLGTVVGTYNFSVTGSSNIGSCTATRGYTITITKANLTVQVSNQSMTQGDNVPALTSSIAGLIFPDMLTYNYATTATNASPVGTYPINATVLGAVLSNYNLVVNPGTLTIVPQATNIVAQSTGQTVCSGVTIPLSVTATGNNLTYQWYKDNNLIPGAISSTYIINNITNNEIYFVSVSGLAGSAISSQITLIVNQLPNVSISGVAKICIGQSTTLTGNGALTYVWGVNPNQSIVVTPNINQSFSVVGTDFNGCQSSAIITVTVNSLPNITATATPATICIGQTTTFNGFGALANSYIWTNGVTNGTSQSPNITNTYTVTGTDANGCSNTNTVNLTVNNLPTINITGNTTPICQGQSATMSANGAANYSWNNGSTTSAITVNPATTQTYIVTGTDANSCVNTATSIVTVLGIPTVTGTIAPSNAVCFGTPVTIAGLGANTYTINGIANNALAFIATTTATYTITGSNGTCGSMATVITLTVNQLPNVTATATPATICIGETTTFNGFGALANSYIWTNGVTNGTSQSPNTTNTYTVTGTDANGCSNTNTVNLTVNNLPTINISGNTTPICQGQSATLTANGAANYSWNNGSTTSAITVNPATTQTYIVTGTDANSCVNTAQSIVTVLGIPTITGTIAPSNAVCFGTPVTIAGLGADTYTINGIANNALAFIANTTATYTITGSNGTCGSMATEVTLTVNQLPNITATATPATICIGQTTTFNGFGALANSYIWTNGVTNGTSQSPNITNTYTVTGTDANGCSNTNTVNLTVNNLPTINITGNSTPICQGQSATLTANGAANYTWNNGSTTSAITVNPATTQTYIVTGTDANSCVNTAQSIVTVLGIPTVTGTIAPSNAVCFGTPVTIAGLGADTYTINGIANNALAFIANTTATYTITGSNGTCGSMATEVTLTVNQLPNITATATPATICIGQTTTFNGFGALANSYIWTNGVTNGTSQSPNITNTYTVTGTDANGCSNTNTVNLTVNNLPTINITGNTTPICQGQSATMSANGAANYSWNNGSTTSAITVNPATTQTYIVTGTDANSCVNTATSIVTVLGIPTVTGTIAPSNAVCFGTPVTIAGLGADTYTINGIANNALAFIATTSGSYLIEGSNGSCGNGFGSVSLTVNQLPSITILGANATICQTQSTSLSAIGAVSYIWSNNSTTSAIVVSPALTQAYTVTGIDVNGCSATSNTNITVNEVPTITLSNAGAICLGQSFGITASGLNIGSYSWNNGENTASILVSPAITSSYRVTATGINGCATFVGTTVSVNTLPVFANITSSTIYKTNYNQSIGSNTQTYTLTGGNLPLGMTLSNNGIISGASTAVGNYNFTITGGLGNCTATRAYTITVNPALLSVSVNNASIFQFEALPAQSVYRNVTTGLASGESINVTYLLNVANSNIIGNYTITPIVSGSTLGNYMVTTVAGTLQILSPQQLSVRVADVVREYGNPDPVFVGTVLGINPSQPNIVVSYYTNTSPTSPFGTYPILATITGSDAFRYSLTSNTVGGLTIRTRRLIVRTNDFSLADGQPFPADFPTTITGLLSGSLPKITFDTELIPGETNKFNIIPEIEGIDLNLYSLVLFPGILTIRPGITVIGDNFSRNYGQANPVFSGQVLGVKNADPYVYVTFKTNANPNSPVGDYSVFPIITGSDAAKYGFVTVLGVASVTKANLTVAAANLSRVENNTNPFEFRPVFTGLVNNDLIQVDFSTDAPDVSTTGTNFSIFPAPSGTALLNYNVTTVSGRLQILASVPDPVAITITAGNFSRKYGEADGQYGFETTGTINSNDNISISIQSNASLSSPIGDIYTLTPIISGTDAYKYIFTTVAGKLTIEKNTVTIKALDYTREYGEDNPTFFNVSIAGLRNGDQILAYAYVNENQFSNAGTYPILTQTVGNVSSNYDLQTIAGTLTIDKASLTVIGGIFERMYNQPNPDLVYNIIGYKGADQISDIDKLPVGQTLAILTSPVQSAPYTVIYSQAQDNNYLFVYTEGSIKINPATQSIVGFNSFARVKTGESVTLTANATSGLPIEVSTKDATIVQNVGLLMNGQKDGITTVKLIQQGDNNYLPADSVFITIVSTSTGIKTTTLIGMFGSRSMFKGVQSTFQSTEVPGYKYVWSYRPSSFVPQNINWVNPQDTLTPKVSIVFPANIDVTLPSQDSARVYMGDIICMVYDDLGNLSKVNTLPLMLNVDAQAAVNAQLAQTLAVLECPPAVSNCNKTFISTFNFGKRVNDESKDKTDKSCNGGFTDFTTSGKIDTLIMGNAYNFKIGATVAANTSSLIFFALWIDYDNNGSFNDPDDFIRASSEATNLYEIKSMAIRINDKYEGPRRVRISMKTSKISPNESCMVEGVVGETEDYMVFLKKPQALEIANLLSPNNDGKNDIFIVKGINPKMTNKLTIMDRDGVIKYETEDYQNDFDGNNPDHYLHDGTYYYFFSHGEDMLKGFFELRRK